LKGLLKGFWWPFRSLKSVKYLWSYGPNKVYDMNSTGISIVLCVFWKHMSFLVEFLFGQ